MFTEINDKTSYLKQIYFNIFKIQAIITVYITK